MEQSTEVAGGPSQLVQLSRQVEVLDDFRFEPLARLRATRSSQAQQADERLDRHSRVPWQGSTLLAGGLQTPASAPGSPVPRRADR
jgi:hypothetical protein